MTLLRLPTYYGLVNMSKAAYQAVSNGENNIIADMYAGDAYEGRFTNSVVINGVLYYNTQGNGLYAQTSIPGVQAIDHTHR